MGIVGLNGVGKFMFIKVCMGLLLFVSGWVKFFGELFDKVVMCIGYVL